LISVEQLSALLHGFCNAGLVASRGVLMQNAFQYGTIKQAERFFEAFSAGCFISADEHFLNGGAHGRFERNVALTIPLGDFNTFFGGLNSWQDAIPSLSNFEGHTKNL
jgi:hypothetical protein